MLLDLFLGVLFGVFFLRAGLSSIFPLLIWIPALQNHVEFGFVLGIASAGLARGLNQNEFSSREDLVIGFASAAVGLLVFEHFISMFPLDSLIFPLLLFALAAGFVGMLLFNPRDVAGGLFMLAAGWWLLHERTVPMVLPAFFLGWFGFAWKGHSIYSHSSRAQKMRDACIGCASGFLPGLGPGLINAAWVSGQASYSMGVSNLVFSLGLLSLTGNVRSAVAAYVGNVSTVSWGFLLLLFAGGIFLSFFLHEWFSSFSFVLPDEAWIVFQIAGIFLLGGWIAGAVVLASYSLRRLFESLNVSHSTGMLLLIPSIAWFYGPF